MAFATLLFYAATSFFLALIALATGGAAVLHAIVSGPYVVGATPEPWQTILEAFTIVVPLMFIALAAYSIFVRSGDAPATARDIRELVDALEDRSSKDRAPLNRRP